MIVNNKGLFDFLKTITNHSSSRKSIPYLRLYRFSQWYNIFRELIISVPFRFYRFGQFIIIFILLQWPNPSHINQNYLIIVSKKRNLGTMVKGSNHQRPHQTHVNSDRIQCLSLTFTTTTRYFQKE